LITKSVKRASYADQRPDLQIKQDDRDLCEDDNDDVDELLDPESLRRTVVSHRTRSCFTTQEIRTLNIWVMFSKGTTQISEPMPLSATASNESALPDDAYNSKVMHTLSELDRRRDQQNERHEDGPVVPSKSAVLDTPACQKSERNAESRDCNQGDADSRCYGPCVSVWCLAGFLLPSLSDWWVNELV
jgi:hypothetical protein